MGTFLNLMYLTKEDNKTQKEEISMKKIGKIGLIALLCFAIMTGTIYADSVITGTKSSVEGYGTSDDVSFINSWNYGVIVYYN